MERVAAVFGRAEDGQSQAGPLAAGAIEPVGSAAAALPNEQAAARAPGRAPGRDPRRPELLVGARAGEAQGRAEDAASAEKAALQRRQVERQGSQSLEVLHMIELLRSRDAEVRAHEAAHVAAGGSYITGGASYTTERGPDGRSYAVGGEVGIDTQPIPGRPEETANKMRIVRAAALAPIDPSSADLAVAAAAAAMEAEAMAQAAAMRAEDAARSAQAVRSYGGAAGGPGNRGGSEKRVDVVA
ncbi:MAG TPA: putative metalloprotease CJM1_0395 family protein [Rectinemataceae bacterium]|nr:putative metalloprotease CJM1_0395 family protein [Rectinemataceae bacterium]